MEAVRSSETLANFYRTTWRHIIKVRSSNLFKNSDHSNGHTEGIISHVNYCNCKQIDKYKNVQDTIKGNSLGRAPKWIIIDHATIFRRKRSLTSTYLGRCGYNWVTEDARIGFPPSGDRDQHDDPCSRMLQPAWHEGLKTEENGANRAQRHRVNFSKSTVMRSFIFIGKLWFVIINLGSPPNDSPCVNKRVQTNLLRKREHLTLMVCIV
jgi:hypothetical protein